MEYPICKHQKLHKVNLTKKQKILLTLKNCSLFIYNTIALITSSGDYYCFCSKY